MPEPKISTQQIAEKKSSYRKWIDAEGVPLIEGFFLDDIAAAPLSPWDRVGGNAVRVCLEGTGETNDAYICEIPPGKSLKPQKHMFEELVYIVSGRGATTMWQDNGPKRTFEWQEGSLFSPPLNTNYQHFNGSGTQPARYLAVTSAPIMINLIHNIDFVFNCAYVFKDRFNSEDDYFSKEGTWYAGRVWETNFVPDAKNLNLIEWKERGAGGSQVRFQIAENTMCGHVSQFPVGTYKKAHYHGPGAHVIILSGQGYSLMWPKGQPIQREIPVDQLHLAGIDVVFLDRRQRFIVESRAMGARQGCVFGQRHRCARLAHDPLGEDFLLGRKALRQRRRDGQPQHDERT